MSSLTPLPLDANWTPEQALAVYEWLHRLADELWVRHEPEFLWLIQQRYDQEPPAQRNLFDDDLPF